MSRGGARPGAGRKPGGDPTRTFSVNPRGSEYAILKNAAALAGKTLSRFLVDAGLKEAASLAPQEGGACGGK